MPKLNHLISARKHELVVLLIIATLLFSNYIILNDMPNPIGKDSQSHLISAVNVIMRFNLSSFLKHPFQTYDNAILFEKNYPVLFFVVAALIRSFFNADLMFMTSTLFLIPLLYSTYKIAKLIKDEEAGFLSVMFISFYPIIYLNSRYFNLELAQTAMVCLAVYFLIQTKGFTERKYSIIFGVISGIGMLSKQMFPIFIIGPLLVVTVNSFRYFKQNRLQLNNLIIAILLCGIVSFLFFYRKYLTQSHMESLLKQSLIFIDGELEVKSGTRWFNKDHLLFYLNSLKQYQIGPFNLILFLVSTPFFLLQKHFRKYRLFLLSWIVLPLILFTIRPGKYSEYTMAYLPAIAVITSLGILSINRRFIRTSLIIGTLILNLFIFVTLTFPKYTPYLWSSDISRVFLKHIITRDTPASVYNYFSPKASDGGYKAIKFLNELLKNKKTKIGFIDYIYTTWWVNQRIKALLLLYYKAPYEMKDVIFDSADPEQDLDKFDIFIFTSVSQHDGPWLNKDYFLRDLRDLEVNDSSESSTHYFVWDGVSPKPPNVRIIYQEHLEKVISYFSKVKLIHKIDSPHLKILIYKNVSPSSQNIQDNVLLR